MSEDYRYSINYTLAIKYDILNQILADELYVMDLEPSEYTVFSYLYCLAYKKMIISNGLKNNDSSILALTDYNTFNSFMNICLNEYQIYSDICTGKVLYFPYQDLAAFILEDIIHKNLLFDYLNCELPNIFKKEKTKKKTLI